MASTDTNGHHPSPARRLFALFRPERVDIGVLFLLSVLNGVLLLATPLAVDAVRKGGCKW